MFVTVSHFQPTLTFVDKSRSLLLECSPLRVGFSLAWNCYTIVEVTDNDKHSSLFWYNDGRKKIYTTDPCCLYFQTSQLSLIPRHNKLECFFFIFQLVSASSMVLYHKTFHSHNKLYSIVSQCLCYSHSLFIAFVKHTSLLRQGINYSQISFMRQAPCLTLHLWRRNYENCCSQKCQNISVSLCTYLGSLVTVTTDIILAFAPWSIKSYYCCYNQGAKVSTDILGYNVFNFVCMV